jgi:uncharacterized membrane protein YeaQ/YmgE (transglycosylase-associated protein family)
MALFAAPPETQHPAVPGTCRNTLCANASPLYSLDKSAETSDRATKGANTMGFIWTLLIAVILGGIAGWAAGKIIKGTGNGLMMNVGVGVAGGLVGAYILPWLESLIPWLGLFTNAIIGSVILLLLLQVYNPFAKKE